jgi:protein-S-isoprenylcysteine O-methyltransferase Ste14
VNPTQQARLFVFGQFALLALLAFWPSDHVGFGLLDFLFELVGVLCFFGGAVLIYVALRRLFAGSLPKLSGSAKEKTMKSLRIVWPKPSDDAKLVTDGVFKRMRHPVYTGLLLVGYGIGIASGPVPQLFFAIALHVVLRYKSELEEKFLAEKFPEYPNYVSRTGRFFPKVED